MDWKAEDIISSFNGVIRDSKNMNSSELEKKYSVFKETFSKLYDVAIDSVATGNVQEAFALLQMMIKARTGLQNGRTNKLNTDVYVGNELGKIYIYPKTNTPSTADYKQAIDQIKEKIKQNELEDQEDQEDQKDQEDS
jgi:hypothetical protein